MWWLEFAFAADIPELAAYQQEPSIEEVQRWVAEAAGVDGVRLERWFKRVARAPAIPEVKLDTGWSRAFDKDWEFYAADGIIDSSDELLVEAPEALGLGYDLDIALHLTWRLDELYASPELMRAMDQMYDAVELRDRLMTRATKVYFERRRAQVERDLATDQAMRWKRTLEIDEHTAALNAWTNGKFSEALTARP